MKEPADENGGRRTTPSFGQRLAQRALDEVPYLQEAITRSTTPEEDVALAWAALGLTHARNSALTEEHRGTLNLLEAAIDAGTLSVSNYAGRHARRLIDRARSGDREALGRMLSWARREGL